MNSFDRPMPITRRLFVAGGCTLISSMAVGQDSSQSEVSAPKLRVGLVTDLHYADKPAAGTRHYRETLGKFAEASEEFQRRKVDFLVELGDLIDAAESVEHELTYLRRINRELMACCQERHYVLGNHCVQTLTKAEFLGAIEREASYYSFDRGGVHFIVLDACYRADGAPYGRNNFQWTDANLPLAELDWLKQDLEKTPFPVIVFTHQRLDTDDNHGIKNASAARRLLEASGKVVAVFQGHSHKNDLKTISGVAYCTLVAMVEGTGLEHSGYSVLELDPLVSAKLIGYRKQLPREFRKPN